MTTLRQQQLEYRIGKLQLGRAVERGDLAIVAIEDDEFLEPNLLATYLARRDVKTKEMVERFANWEQNRWDLARQIAREMA